MLDWTPLVEQLGYKNEEEMWTDLYVKKGLSISQLVKKLDVSRNTIRSAFERLGIPLRNRGGANNQKFEMTDELIAEIREVGITPVAKRLGVSYTTVYKRLYRVKGINPITPTPEPPDAEQADERSADSPVQKG